MTDRAFRALRGPLLAGAAAALAVLVTACASGGAPGGGASSGTSSSAPPSPSSSPSDSPSTSPAPTGDAAAPAPGEHVRGLPAGAEGTFDSPAGAAWSPDAGVLLVVTYGSSSCPLLAEARADWDDTGETLDVGMVEPDPGRACTMDYAPTTSAVAVPADADAGTPVTVRLGDLGEVEVAPRATDGEAGPVAWVPAAG
ncbi:hypothetical protein ACQP60_20245 [Isoptericola variabilis]|uniref:hypothetical protein n=1 Tax=Isoptericola variabilis TaxID=139208 RepID=UPI003D1F91DC